MAVKLEPTTMGEVARIQLGINTMALEIESLRQAVGERNAEIQKQSKEIEQLKVELKAVKGKASDTPG